MPDRRGRNKPQEQSFHQPAEGEGGIINLTQRGKAGPGGDEATTRRHTASCREAEAGREAGRPSSPFSRPSHCGPSVTATGRSRSAIRTSAASPAGRRQSSAWRTSSAEATTWRRVASGVAWGGPGWQDTTNEQPAPGVLFIFMSQSRCHAALHKVLPQACQSDR